MHKNKSVLNTQIKEPKPTYEEIAYKLLTGETRTHMDRLMSFMKETKMLPHWYASNSFNFKYQGQIVFRFSIGKGSKNIENAMNHIEIYMTVAQKSDLDDVLFDLPEDMREFYFKNLRYCTQCKEDHGKGKSYRILGNEYFICAEPEIKLCALDKDILEYCKKFVRVRRDNIEYNTGK